MAFSQSAINAVTVHRHGPELFITWQATTPGGQVFQVYVDGNLSWYGTSRRCYVPISLHITGLNIWVDVGSVAPAEGQSDFSANLASLARNTTKAQVSWLGGSYLDSSGGDNVEGFRIFASTVANGPIDFSAPQDVVPAYPGGWICDGFGLGGFGLGGFGRASTEYVWTSGSLPSGTWLFAVIAFDKQGNNRSSGQTAAVNVTAAPRAPAPAASGRRLSYTYSGSTTRQVTLNWQASPSA
jgi:hypothetical protein